jgi:hypothetical protein
MSAPTVTLSIDLEGVLPLRDQQTALVKGFSTVYVVHDEWDDGRYYERVDTFVVRTDYLRLTAVEKPEGAAQ